MIDKAKVRELATELREKTIPSGYEIVITKWLEQNPHESVVVGLSDSQVDCLADYYFGLMRGDKQSKSTIKNAINKWLKTQTFTQPSDVAKRTISRLTDELKQCYDIIKSQQFTPSWDDAPSWANWLAQDRYGVWRWYSNRPTSHKTCWFDHAGDCDTAYEVKNWKQTLQERPAKIHKALEWANPVKVTTSNPEESTVADVSVVETKRSATINWDNAPKNAVIAAMMTTWWDEKGKEITTCRWQHFQENRPKPTPVVTVGDIWIHTKTGNKYYVDGFCQSKINDEWVKSVMYHVGGARYTRTLDDFIAKFERVS